jgi:hypothetical protein
MVLGRPDQHTSDILTRLVADTELVSQLTLRKEAIAVARGTKLARGTLGYLSVVIYGPRRRLADVGDFMTRCDRFLEDPVGCDRDVPYINPQCLFSLHERPPTTFEISQPQINQVEDFARAYSDILAGFETTDRLKESPTPDILRTSLQA